jgi:hypothetical protein
VLPDRVTRLRRTLDLDADRLHPSDVLARLEITVTVRDVRDTGLPDASVDLIVSSNTLEHVPSDALPPIIRELRRISAPQAVMDHHIDMADHYAYFDESLSPFNFLRFSDRAWSLIDNTIQHQNRLRLSQHRELQEHAGFTVVQEDNVAGPPEKLHRIPVAPRFASLPCDDLLTIQSWMTAVPRLDARRRAPAPVAGAR